MSQTQANVAGVSFGAGQGGLPRFDVTTPWSRAEVYLQGAHLTHFQRHGEAPLLFLSESSRFTASQPIRGGVPVVFPWFGPREGLPQHGYARTSDWNLSRVGLAADGEVRLDFNLPRPIGIVGNRPFAVRYSIWIGRGLRFEFEVTNQSPRDPLDFEECLHTYFTIADITKVHVRGLSGARYLDAVASHAEKTDAAPAITFGEEVDRLYFHHAGPVEIHDPGFNRCIRISKESSQSTVVWNPWIAKARRMPDFGDDEYQRMLCVESGNAGPDGICLPPAASHLLRVRIESLPL